MPPSAWYAANLSDGLPERSSGGGSPIAVEVPGENYSNEWCESVSDEEYAKR